MNQFIRLIKAFKIYFFFTFFILSISISAYLTLLAYVIGELSYDKWLPNSSDIVRIQSILRPPGSSEINVAGAPKPLLNTIQSELRSVLGNSTYVTFSPANIRVGEHSFSGNVAFSDAKFFEVFQVVTDGIANPLNEPGSIALSTTKAEAMFPGSNAIGREVLLDGIHSLKVTAIYPDFPKNSHFRPELVVRISEVEQVSFGLNDWANIGGYIYANIGGVQLADIEEKISVAVNANLDTSAMGVPASSLFRFWLNPVTSIHTSPSVNGELSGKTNVNVLIATGILAFVILILGAWNSGTLIFSVQQKRLSENMIRQCFGEKTIIMFIRSISETGLLVLLSTVFATLLSSILIPVLQNILSESIYVANLFNVELLTIILVTVIFVSFVISAFLVYHTKHQFSKYGLRNVKHMKSASAGDFALIGINIFVSCILLGGSVSLWLQHDFMFNSSKLSNLERIVVFKDVGRVEGIPSGFANLVKERLVVNQDITISAVSDLPGTHIMKKSSIKALNQDQATDVLTEVLDVDENFFRIFNLELLSGRSYDGKNSSDALNTSIGNGSIAARVVINETAMRALGMQDAQKAIGSRVSYTQNGESSVLEIVGIVKDFNWRSFHSAVSPMMIFYNPNTSGHLLIYKNEDDLQHFIHEIDHLFGSIVHEWALIGTAVEKLSLFDFWMQQYRNEKVLSKISFFLCGLVISISTLGIFIASAFISRKKHKELAIRRIIGESRIGLTLSSISGFFTITIFSYMLALPVILYLQTYWLKQFAYKHTNLWGSPVLVLTLLLLTALCVFIIQYRNVSKMSLVEFLKRE